MLVLALGCIGAGSFELHRFHEKRHVNGELTVNARAATTPLTTALVPLVGQGSPPPDDTIRYRTISASGIYQTGHEQYVGDQSQGGRQGFLVLTALRTSLGTLLVARGFVPATASGTRPADVPPPPVGTVQVAGRLYPGQPHDDELGRLGHDEIASVNPAQQAARLGTPTFQAYLALTAGQPGAAGLRVLPGPDLSNPSGGAGALQLLSYVVQWYVFALLALIAPFLFARSEVREAQRRFLGIDPDAAQFDLEAGAAHQPPELGVATTGGRAPVLRGSGEVARPAQQAGAEWERGERLAERYGRSLGPLTASRSLPDVSPDRRGAFALPEPAARTSASVPHRSDDAYHGGYNDYLWQLALADGEAPGVVLPPSTRSEDPTGRAPKDARVADVGLAGEGDAEPVRDQPAAHPVSRHNADG